MPTVTPMPNPVTISQENIFLQNNIWQQQLAAECCFTGRGSSSEMVAQIKENNSSELSPEEIRTSSNAQINYHVAAQKGPGLWEGLDATGTVCTDQACKFSMRRRPKNTTFMKGDRFTAPRGFIKATEQEWQSKAATHACTTQNRYLSPDLRDDFQ